MAFSWKSLLLVSFCNIHLACESCEHQPFSNVTKSQLCVTWTKYLVNNGIWFLQSVLWKSHSNFTMEYEWIRPKYFCGFFCFISWKEQNDTTFNKTFTSCLWEILQVAITSTKNVVCFLQYGRSVVLFFFYAPLWYNHILMSI